MLDCAHRGAPIQPLLKIALHQAVDQPRGKRISCPQTVHNLDFIISRRQKAIFLVGDGCPAVAPDGMGLAQCQSDRFQVIARNGLRCGLFDLAAGNAEECSTSSGLVISTSTYSMALLSQAVACSTVQSLAR